ncbi:MAG: bifunctional phosphoribosylaminoimidazolecarboxamide formyltransferase/IMP cyclohydrolase [Actinomycetales bacterium]|nr:bifunctional phosphoribosylaminoimidazolecarboxamide formyltransferase/IMP cyclohydrolase [Actinomycetales bacterium]
MAQWSTVTDATTTPDDPTAARRPVRRVLLSVSDTTGLVELATALRAHGAELIASGGTARTLTEAGLPVTEVADLTGVPALLGGRVKTLHPVIHAGLLADPDLPEHRADLAALGAQPFDCAVVSLYPFAEAVASGASAAECLARLDVGGPTMIRAAAKNHAAVAVLTRPEDYPAMIAALEAGGTMAAQRLQWAATAFAHTAAYDAAIATWFADLTTVEPTAGPAAPAGPTWLPAHLHRSHQLVGELRYGENPHQAAVLLRARDPEHGVATATLRAGKSMSYSNYLDADAAYRAAYDHAQACIAIIKHANPCGVAVADTLAQAHARALACDPDAAFGGVVAATREVDAAAARAITSVFTEVIIAPGFTSEALAVLAERPSLRVLQVPAPHPGRRLEYRTISAGLLAQVADQGAPADEPGTWRIAAGSPPDAATAADCEFAWCCVRAPRSNAIVLVADTATVAIAAGQVSRVAAAQLAVTRAGDRAQGAVAASDGFFPFPDGLRVLAAAGVGAVVAPGGSVRDDEVAAAAAEAGITLLLTGVRHFSH